MTWLPFKISSKRVLGIEIGASSIKVVELNKAGKKIILENYAEVSTAVFQERPFRTFEKNILSFSTEDIVKVIRAILEETKIKTKKVFFSIPDFTSFFTWFDLPPMTEKEIPQAINFIARQHIPFPLSEATLGWQLIDGQFSGLKKNKIKIILVAVPNEIISQYQEIAKFSQLELGALEAEVFALCRSLLKEEKKPIALVKMGAQSTTCSIVDNSVLKRSHNLEVSGNNLTYLIANSLGINYNKAEQLKIKIGIISPSLSEAKNLAPEENIKDLILPFIDLMLIEIGKITDNFFETEGKKVEKIILAGGAAYLPGLKDYFQEKLKIEVSIAQPFSGFSYPPILENTLNERGSFYAVAVGMALRGLE